ncbi:MAG: hypothetical protein KA764_08315 [Anaerolineales bacterium]|nr:hypothetical protein [Anaerolineales bacterium]
MDSNPPARLGQTATFARRLTQTDFDRFAALSGDDNPIHVDPAFAARSRFGRPVAHGMLLYSVLCGAVSRFLPGALQIEQTLKFPTPTYADEPLTVRLAVTGAAAGQLELATLIFHTHGDLACEGTARVWAPGVQPLEAAPAGPPTAPESAAAYKHLALGQTVALSRRYTDADLAAYAALAGDPGPLFAPAPGALPGPLLGSLWSTLLGTRLPGRGTNWLKLRLRFPAPAGAAATLTARVTITRLRPEKDLVDLRAECLTPAGQTAAEGEVLVLAKDLEPL